MKNANVIVVSTKRVTNNAMGLPRYMVTFMKPLTNKQRNKLVNMQVRKVSGESSTYYLSGYMKGNNIYQYIMNAFN